jgi:hypothetical protein
VHHPTYAAAILAALLIPAAAQTKAITKQAERGRELFLKSPKGTACGTCHTMAGVGTEVGPDLRTLASVVPPRGLVAAIQMTMTERVQEVKTATDTFAGLQKSKQGDDLEIWDLSQNPPVLRKIAAKDVESMNRNTKWKHPPAATEYTSQELADIIGFLKWASIGQTKEIKPDDVE